MVTGVNKRGARVALTGQAIQSKPKQPSDGRFSLYHQLLVLMPFFKIVEENRRVFRSDLPPLSLDVVQRPSGLIDIYVGRIPSGDGSLEHAELKLSLNNGRPGQQPPDYQSGYVFAWTYFLGDLDFTSPQRAAVDRWLDLEWAKCVIMHEQTIDELGLPRIV